MLRYHLAHFQVVRYKYSIVLVLVHAPTSAFGRMGSWRKCYPAGYGAKIQNQRGKKNDDRNTAVTSPMLHSFERLPSVHASIFYFILPLHRTRPTGGWQMCMTGTLSHSHCVPFPTRTSLTLYPVPVL
jgi:hypothetical protein